MAGVSCAPDGLAGEAGEAGWDTVRFGKGVWSSIRWSAPTVLILAIDTTTRGGSIAVSDDDTLLALVPGDETRTHIERFPADMAAALDQAGVARSALELVAVAQGPGAFTGLRIGLAAAQGLAMTLGLPVAGVSALDALAWAADETQIRRGGAAPEANREVRRIEAAQPRPLVAPWMDAQRGDVFAALYEPDAREPARGVLPWAVLESAVTSSPAALLAGWRQRVADRPILFVGDAVARDAALITEAGAGRWRAAAAPAPLAPAIAQIGWRMAKAGLAGPPHALAPIYVRRPDVEIERERQGRP